MNSEEMVPIRTYGDCGIQDLAESTIVIGDKFYNRLYRRNIETGKYWFQYKVKRVDGVWMWLNTPKVQHKIDDAIRK